MRSKTSHTTFGVLGPVGGIARGKVSMVVTAMAAILIGSFTSRGSACSTVDGPAVVRRVPRSFRWIMRDGVGIRICWSWSPTDWRDRDSMAGMRRSRA